jgi:hypothetical protein
MLAISTAGAAPPQAQSEALAKQLTELLDKNKRDSMAARDDAGPDQFFAALYIPGIQLLVVSAKYTAPALMNEKIIKQEYREAYLDLSSASVPTSKVLIEDMKADGLRPKREGNDPFDIYNTRGSDRTTFDGEWKKHKMSEEDYMKLYAEAEAHYVRMLTALIDQAKKSGL